jgi:hypothetical protein
MILFMSSVAVMGFMPSSTRLARPAASSALCAAPKSEEDKVFYTLGLNVARQVGSELKTVLSPKEMKIMVKGFEDRYPIASLTKSAVYSL